MSDRKGKHPKRPNSRKRGATDSLDAALEALEAVGRALDDSPGPSPVEAPYRPAARPLAAGLAAEAATNAIAAMLASDGLIVDPTLPSRDLVRDEIRRWIHASSPQ
jgi:hypothetical protein